MTTVLLPLSNDAPLEEVAGVLDQIVYALRGWPGQGIQINLTEYSHEEKYAAQFRNRNSDGGGLHFAIWHSLADLTDPPIFEVQDAGVFLDALNVFNLTVGNDLTVTDDLTVGGTLFVDEGIDVTGGGTISGPVSFTGTVGFGDVVTLDDRLVSTVATGTAPFTVASTTKVTNLNADLLDSLSALDFVLQGGDLMDGDYEIDGELSVSGNVALGDDVTDVVDIAGEVNIGGDTLINASLEVIGDGFFETIDACPPSPGNDQSIFIRHNSTRSAFSIGADDTLQPDLIFKDPLGNETVRIGHSSNPHSLEVWRGGLLVDAPSTDQILLRHSSSSELGYWTMGSSSSSTPNFQIHGVGGTEYFEITETGRVNIRSMEVYDGDLIVSGTGALTVGSGGISSDGNNVFGNGSGDITLINGTLRVANNFDDGDGIPTSSSNSDGYWAVDFNGTTMYIPIYFAH